MKENSEAFMKQDDEDNPGMLLLVLLVLLLIAVYIVYGNPAKGKSSENSPKFIYELR